MAAAVSYYALFSLAPLLFLLTGVIGALAERFFGQQSVDEELLQILENILGQQSAEFVFSLVEGVGESTTVSSALPIFTLIGLGILLWSASNIFNYLHEALNTIWGVKPLAATGFWQSIRRRLVAFAVVLFLGLLLVAYLIIITLLSILVPILAEHLPEALDFLPDIRVLQVTQFVTLLILGTALFAALYRILPDVEIAWRDVIVGAAFTAFLFGVGTFFLSIYFSFYSSSLYGVAGSLIVLLLWFYYSAQIFMYGAEFTYVYAIRYGSKIVPADYATANVTATDELDDKPDEGRTETTPAVSAGSQSELGAG